MKKLLLFAAILPLLSSTCQKGPDSAFSNSLETSLESIEMDSAGGRTEITVTANADWGVWSEDKEWCNVSPEGGLKGVSKVVVSLSENKTYEPRQTDVVFACGTLRKTVSVLQEAAEKPAEEDIEITVPEGYSLVWHDEFLESEIPANSNDCLVNTEKWRFENWQPGYVNNELQRYVPYGVLDGVHTAWVEDGVLNIQALKHNGQVISARMNTRSSWKYGRMEARIKLPSGKGTWPAFWMMPDNQSDGWPTCGEIDIMEEVGYHPNYTSSSIHTYAYNHTKNTQKTKEIYTSGAESSFHVYACEWTSTSIKFFTDGVQFLEFKNDGNGDKTTWPFDKNFYITLNLAWGGSWGGCQGVNEAALPCTMQVDWVRVFQKQ